VVPVPVSELEGGGHPHEIRLTELFAGLEGLVEHGTGQHVAHLQPDECLAAARGRL
jgi:hypothetical protein